MSLQQQGIALITEASSGIGLELARLFAADGNQVVLVARNTQKLDQLAEELRNDHNIPAHVFSCDLAVPQTEQLVSDLDRAQLQIDYLVNNAGFGAVDIFAICQCQGSCG